MKKKICIIIFCLISVMSCAFGFTSCKIADSNIGNNTGIIDDNTGNGGGGNAQVPVNPEEPNIPVTPEEPAPHIHSLYAHSANRATCQKEGNTEYWSCDCGKYFSDAEGNTAITLSSTIINKSPHT